MSRELSEAIQTELLDLTTEIDAVGPLVLINGTLDEIPGHAESELDAHTRWAVIWYDQFGLKEGEYETAETMASAKNVAVAALPSVALKAQQLPGIAREQDLFRE